MTKKILCFFSGGLDSTALLYKLLSDEAYLEWDILVHHLVLKNVEKRAFAESIAVKNILDFFKQSSLRPFVYTESSHEYRFLKGRHYSFDSMWCAYIAGLMVNNDPAIKKIAFGLTLSEKKGSKGFDHRLDAALKILKAVLDPASIERFELPLIRKTKKDIWDSLPAELRELTWSCRKPRYEKGFPTICGKCPSCRLLQEILSSENALTESC